MMEIHNFEMKESLLAFRNLVNIKIIKKLKLFNFKKIKYKVNYEVMK